MDEAGKLPQKVLELGIGILKEITLHIMLSTQGLGLYMMVMLAAGSQFSLLS